jgi:hypothetical protein
MRYLLKLKKPTVPAIIEALIDRRITHLDALLARRRQRLHVRNMLRHYRESRPTGG